MGEGLNIDDFRKAFRYGGFLRKGLRAGLGLLRLLGNE
jgi:hypothetical protein